MSNATSVAVRAGSPRPALRFLLLFMALFGAVAAPSSALASGSATDQQAPVLYPGTATPAWAFATQRVVATFRITDNESGAALPVVTATADNAPFTAVAATVKRISGDGKDSQYTATITVPVGAVGGSWTFATNQLVDHVGNASNGNFKIASFFVIGLGWDTTPPSLVSYSVNPSALDLAGAAGSVTVTLRVTDDYTGTRSPVIQAVSASGKTITVTATLASGTKNDGTWTAKVVFPAGSETGSWSLKLLALVDEWGNTAKSGSSLGGLSVSSTTGGGGNGGGGNGGGGNGGGGNGGGGGGGTTVVTTTTTTTTTSGDQGGVLGARVNSKSYLTFAGSAKGLKLSKKGSLAFSLKCNGVAACKGSVRLYVTKKGKRYKIVSRRVSVVGGKTVKVTFKLTKVGRREVKRGKAIKPSVSIWTDGIKTPRSKKITLSTKLLAIKKG